MVFLQVYFMETFWKDFLCKPLGNSFQNHCAEVLEPVGHLPAQSLHLVAHVFPVQTLVWQLRCSRLSKNHLPFWEVRSLELIWFFTEKCSLLVLVLFMQFFSTQCCTLGFASCLLLAVLSRGIYPFPQSQLWVLTHSLLCLWLILWGEAAGVTLWRSKQSTSKWHMFTVLIFQ